MDDHFGNDLSGETRLATNIFSKDIYYYITVLYEPAHEKINTLGFRPGPTQTGLYSQRSRLEAGGFKKTDCTIRVAKTKALISYCTADLRLSNCFHICRLLVFSCSGSYGTVKDNIVFKFPLKFSV